jgi:hypothetical protein
MIELRSPLAVRATATMCALVILLPRICTAGELIRCSGGLVSPNISVADFLQRCGAPASKSVSTQDLRDEYGVKVGTLTTEIWAYTGDTTAPSMTVTVVDGRVQSIEQNK